MDELISEQLLEMDTRLRIILALNERIRDESPEFARRLRETKREYFHGEKD